MENLKNEDPSLLAMKADGTLLLIEMDTGREDRWAIQFTCLLLRTNRSHKFRKMIIQTI